jgi:hypothetical protein
MMCVILIALYKTKISKMQVTMSENNAISLLVLIPHEIGIVEPPAYSSPL